MGVVVVMVEAKSPMLTKESALGENVPMVLDAFAEDSSVVDPSEPFDLYEWALEFSRAAGFEFDRVTDES